jgi:hydrogenase expression/formation protein HypE
MPLQQFSQILLAHGGGGQLTHQLIEHLFIPAFNNPALTRRQDGAVLDMPQSQIAFTTDSYVVQPLFFPGGNIGTLAVNGTVNDLVMCGARPLYLSAGFILEEGFEIATLQQIVEAMQQAAQIAGVKIVTGDTKVVDQGRGDGLFINTAGIGILEHNHPIGPQQVQAGDIVIVNGDIGRHGMAIMAVREGLAFESPIQSDCAPLVQPVLALLEAGIEVHCLRDLTRGGLASALIEIAEVAGVQIRLDETAIPVSEPVQGACEILGLDPLYVANEGRFIAIVAPQDVDRAISTLRNSEDTGFLTQHSPFSPSVIGQVVPAKQGHITLKSSIGIERVIARLSGEQLPRIC